MTLCFGRLNIGGFLQLTANSHIDAIKQFNNKQKIDGFDYYVSDAYGKPSIATNILVNSYFLLFKLINLLNPALNKPAER